MPLSNLLLRIRSRGKGCSPSDFCRTYIPRVSARSSPIGEGQPLTVRLRVPSQRIMSTRGENVSTAQLPCGLRGRCRRRGGSSSGSGQDQKTRTPEQVRRTGNPRHSRPRPGPCASPGGSISNKCRANRPAGKTISKSIVQSRRDTVLRSRAGMWCSREARSVYPLTRTTLKHWNLTRSDPVCCPEVADDLTDNQDLTSSISIPEQSTIFRLAIPLRAITCRSPARSSKAWCPLSTMTLQSCMLYPFSTWGLLYPPFFLSGEHHPAASFLVCWVYEDCHTDTQVVGTGSVSTDRHMKSSTESGYLQKQISKAPLMPPGKIVD